MQERNAWSARPPHEAPAPLTRAGAGTHVVGFGPQLLLDGTEDRAYFGQRGRVGLDAPAQRVGGVPELLARELERDEGRRAGGGAWEGRHEDARAGAPRRDEDAQRLAVRDARRELRDHGGGGDAEAAHVHAHTDPAEVLAHARRRRLDGPIGAGRPPGAGAVVAQVGGGGGRGEPAGRGRREETAAGRQADIRVGACPRPASRKRPKSAPGARAGEARVHSDPQGDPVRDGGTAGVRGDREVDAGGLDHEGLRRIGDEEGGVVGLVVRGVGDPTLAAGLEEAHHDVDGLGGAAGALEPEADEVHADERGLRRPRHRASC